MNRADDALFIPERYAYKGFYGRSGLDKIDLALLVDVIVHNGFSGIEELPSRAIDRRDERFVELDLRVTAAEGCERGFVAVDRVDSDAVRPFDVSFYGIRRVLYYIFKVDGPVYASCDGAYYPLALVLFAKLPVELGLRDGNRYMFGYGAEKVHFTRIEFVILIGRKV